MLCGVSFHFIRSQIKIYTALFTALAFTPSLVHLPTTSDLLGEVIHIFTVLIISFIPSSLFFFYSFPSFFFPRTFVWQIILLQFNLIHNFYAICFLAFNIDINTYIFSSFYLNISHFVFLQKIFF